MPNNKEVKEGATIPEAQFQIMESGKWKTGFLLFDSFTSLQ